MGDAADKARGQLVQITDEDGQNAFHYVETDAQVQTLLGGLDRAGQCTCQPCVAIRKALADARPDLPKTITDLTADFLPCPTTTLGLLNQEDECGTTPLMEVVRRTCFYPDPLAVVKALVEAGADPERWKDVKYVSLRAKAAAEPTIAYLKSP